MERFTKRITSWKSAPIKSRLSHISQNSAQTIDSALSRNRALGLKKAGYKRMVHLFKERGDKVTIGDITRMELSGSNVKEVGDYGMTTLHIAISNNCNDEIIEYLILKGVDVNQRNLIGQTPLFLAVSSSYRLTLLLLQYGAKWNVRDTLTGRTPLMECAGYGEMGEIREILYLLFSCEGLDEEVKDSRGKNALELAEQRGGMERVEEYHKAKEMVKNKGKFEIVQKSTTTFF